MSVSCSTYPSDDSDPQMMRAQSLMRASAEIAFSAERIAGSGFFVVFALTGEDGFQQIWTGGYEAGVGKSFGVMAPRP
jgi:hypothetical protein